MRPGRLKITVQLAADGDRLQCRERPGEAGVLLYIEAGVLEAGVCVALAVTRRGEAGDLSASGIIPAPPQTQKTKQFIISNLLRQHFANII